MGGLAALHRTCAPVLSLLSTSVAAQHLTFLDNSGVLAYKSLFALPSSGTPPEGPFS